MRWHEAISSNTYERSSQLSLSGRIETIRGVRIAREPPPIPDTGFGKSPAVVQLAVAKGGNSFLPAVCERPLWPWASLRYRNFRDV